LRAKRACLGGSIRPQMGGAIRVQIDSAIYCKRYVPLLLKS
jgi:hypothetical protein